MKISFQTQTCGRCGGTGQYPSMRHQGRCLGCGGSGRCLTRAGRYARERYDEAMADKMKIRWSQARKGDLVRLAGDKKYRRVEAIRQTSWTYQENNGTRAEAQALVVELSGLGEYTVRAEDMILRWDAEAFRAACAAVSHLKGATVVDDAPKSAPKDAPKSAPKSAPKKTPKSTPKKTPKSTPKSTPKKAPTWDTLDAATRGEIVRYLRNTRTREAEMFGHQLHPEASAPIEALPSMSGREIREAYAIDVRGLTDDEWERLYYLT
jgi:hypothetical protein